MADKSAQKGHSIEEFSDEYRLEKAVEDAEKLVADAISKPGTHSVTDYAEDYLMEKPTKEVEEVIEEAVKKPAVGAYDVTEFAEDYLMEKAVKDAGGDAKAPAEDIKARRESVSKNVSEEYVAEAVEISTW